MRGVSQSLSDPDNPSITAVAVTVLFSDLREEFCDCGLVPQKRQRFASVV